MVTPTTIETVTSVALAIGAKLGTHYGGQLGQAAVSLLLGEAAWVATADDLFIKIQSGTATGDDVAQLEGPMATRFG